MTQRKKSWKGAGDSKILVHQQMIALGTGPDFPTKSPRIYPGSIIILSRCGDPARIEIARPRRRQ